MIEFDAQDDNQFYFSIFDRAKIEDLSMGENMKAENDSFVVVKQRNGYHIWCTKGKVTGALIFPSLEKVFEFLGSN